jgi:alcohol dehydrogenase class IV
LPNKPETWSLAQLINAPLGETVLLATPAVSAKVRDLPFKKAKGIDGLRANLDTLIVVAGGTLIDQAKVWRASRAPNTRLIAIPSIWGSGAEVSPVAVLDRDGAKEIHIGDELIPDVRCLWPELADDLPSKLAKHACGDAWAHALEGFLSPLADQELQDELAGLVREMMELPLTNDARWFELSAQACAAQARSSVGLIHGIAHQLEGHLRTAHPGAGWGHAKLCSLFLWPVMAFNREHSAKWDELTTRYQLDGSIIFDLLRDLHEFEAYEQAASFLDRCWMDILKDPCSRTNSALVRPASKSYFLERAFA